MQKKISVIIPMFNSELYIKSCIQSVIAQTYSNWEMLIIDDGSTDRSPAIGMEFSRSDHRIQLFSQGHKGVSAARNLGLERAMGKYVFFLDSDDMIHPCLLEEFVRYAEQSQSQMVMCKCRKFRDSQEKDVIRSISERKDEIKWRTAEGAEAEVWFHQRFTSRMGGIGGKMVSRDLTDEIQFNDNLVLGEDTLFIYQLICRQIKVAYLDEKWYCYRQYSDNSVSSSATMMDCQYPESCRMIRDNEYQRGNIRYAITWEEFYVVWMERHFSIMRKKKKEKCQQLKRKADAERKDPLFLLMRPKRKILFFWCFHCYPVYILLTIFFSLMLSLNMGKEEEDEN